MLFQWMSASERAPSLAFCGAQRKQEEENLIGEGSRGVVVLSSLKRLKVSRETRDKVLLF